MNMLPDGVVGDCQYGKPFAGDPGKLTPAHSFTYRSVRASDGAAELPSSFKLLDWAAGKEKESETALQSTRARVSELEAELSELRLQMNFAVERARQEGERIARDLVLAENEAKLDSARASIAAALSGFIDERQTYFRRVEREAVLLALAIAKKILYREVQIDPLLLAGAVRVALEQASQCGGVTLCVPARDIAGWEASFAKLPPELRPQVEGAAEMNSGECRLVSKMGSVDLSLQAQLGEIDRHLLDLLHSPRAGDIQ